MEPLKVGVTCRHPSVGEEARRYAEEKVGRLGHYLDEVQKIEVILDGGRSRSFTAELIAEAGRLGVIACRADGLSATAAFDEAYGKMERQLTKIKEQTHGHDGKRARRATRRFDRRRRVAGAAGDESLEPGSPLW